jgi:hypothetical protein
MTDHPFLNPQRLLGEVERVSNLSFREFLNEFVRKEKPVVITDTYKRWPQMERLTPDFFRKNYGHLTCQIDERTYRLDEYIDRMYQSTWDDPVPYPFKIDMQETTPELMACFNPPLPYGTSDRIACRLIPKKFLKGTVPHELFFGGQGSFFPLLHFDVLHMNTQITQVCGDKEFFLFPPDQTSYLYPLPDNPFVSAIDHPLFPDEQRFPEYRKSKAMRAMVKQGETIFFPNGWWHFTIIHSPCISYGRAHLTDSNWPAFARDNYHAFSQHRPLSAPLILAFLHVIGRIISLNEWIQLRAGRWLDQPLAA